MTAPGAVASIPVDREPTGGGAAPLAVGSLSPRERAETDRLIRRPLAAYGVPMPVEQTSRGERGYDTR